MTAWCNVLTRAWQAYMMTWDTLYWLALSLYFLLSQNVAATDQNWHVPIWSLMHFWRLELPLTLVRSQRIWTLTWSNFESDSRWEFSRLARTFFISRDCDLFFHCTFRSMCTPRRISSRMANSSFLTRVLCSCTDNFFRDIYYSDVVFFGSQSVVDEIIDNLACMLKVPRHCLRVVSFFHLT